MDESLGAWALFRGAHKRPASLVPARPSCAARDDPHPGCSDAAAYVRTALQGAVQGTVLAFVIIVLVDDRVMGSARSSNLDEDSLRMQIGWMWVSPVWQRSGVNVEEKLLMLAHAFEELGCIRVEFMTDVLNSNSRNALLGIGVTEEGVLREHTFIWDGRKRDTIYYSILANEWPRVKEGLRERLATPRAAGTGPTKPGR